VLLQETPSGSLEDVLAGFESATLDHGDIELALLGGWWARFDPEAAFKFAHRRWRMDHPRVVSGIVRAWARQDPQGAYTFGFGRETLGGSPIFRNELVDAVIVGWTESGKPGVLAFAAAMEDINDRQRALRSVARIYLAREGPEATLEWASQVPGISESVRRNLVQSAVSVSARQDPRLAAQWLDRFDLEGFEEAGLHGRIAVGWVQIEPEAALAWTASLEPGWDRDDAVRRAATQWWDDAPAAAAEWTRSQTPAPWLDSALGVYVRRSVISNGYRLDWSALLNDSTLAISDEDTRWGMVAWVLQRWLIVDEPGAQSWLQDNPGLPAKYRRALEVIPENLRTRVLTDFHAARS